MATGVPRKGRARRKTIPFTLAYDGKGTEESVFDIQGENFENAGIVHGGGENTLFYGDNLDVLLYLIHHGYQGRIDLIYIDPPFTTSFDFMNREMEHAYSDALSGGEYIEFLRKRLILMRELLSSDGSIYLHLDAKMAFAMKIIMDELFGEDHCRAFITRKKCSTKNYTRNTFGNISDYIMFYSKGPYYTWNRPFDPWGSDRMVEEYPYIDEETGRRYKKVPIHAPGVRHGETGRAWRGKDPPVGKHWQYTPDKLDELDAAGEICWSSTGNPRRKVFFDPSKGIPVQDIWLHYRDSINQSQKTTGYPTEKNYDMLKMIVRASSDPGDIVLDCFAGSGTTLGAAFECGRKWIGADNSLESIKAIMKRFTGGMGAYGDHVHPAPGDVRTSSDPGARCPFSIFTTPRAKQELQRVCALRQTAGATMTPAGT